MGYIYEELLRRFSEQSGDKVSEHFSGALPMRMWLKFVLLKRGESLRLQAYEKIVRLVRRRS